MVLHRLLVAIFVLLASSLATTESNEMIVRELSREGFDAVFCAILHTSACYFITHELRFK